MRNMIAIDKIILNALEEDSIYGDVSSEMIFDINDHCSGKFIAKENGIFAGEHILKRVFQLLDDSVHIKMHIQEGERVKVGDLIASIEGPTRPILRGERIALNLVQRMSGIATLTNRYVNEIEGFECRVVDTRKTSPGLRIIEKLAVRIGGGYNHRFNLSDTVMIKDNHIKAAGGIKEALKKVKMTCPHTMKVEVEIESLEDLECAIEGGADIVMLDNMSLTDMTQAVKECNARVILEASGNVSLETIRQIAETGVDVISCGKLTHSVSALDISLKF